MNSNQNIAEIAVSRLLASDGECSGKLNRRLAKSGADRIREMRMRERAIECPPVADMARRTRLEKDTAKWLRYYMPNAYPFPFSDGHLALIAKTEHAAMTGEGTATAQPRGEGKSAVLRGVCIKLVVCGVVRFPVLVGWKHGDAKDALLTWLRMLCENPIFAADYPRLCAPFIHSTHATALKNLVWQDTEKKIGASVDPAGKMIILPDSIGAIAARSAQGDAKGLNAMMPDGTILRPDFLIIDDAQDVDQATNPEQVAKTIDRLENVFMGMSGRQHRLAAAAACTVEAKGDVSCHWLERQGWTATRVSRIGVWPDGSVGGTWNAKKDCPERALWDEWRQVYLEHGQQKANTFFRKNRKAMVGKMQVSWQHGYDHDLEVSAYDSAMHAWYNLGEDVFSRGQQNNPIEHGTAIYNLTPALIQTRVDTERQPLIVPDWSRMVVAATDINPSIALTWGDAAMREDQTGAVLAYGLFTEPPIPIDHAKTPNEKERLVIEALIKHGRKLAALPCKPNHWGVDASGEAFPAVLKFSALALKECGIECTPMTGRAGRNYNPWVKSRTGRICNGVYECYERDLRSRWVCFDADYWKEVAQLAWTGTRGAPGSCTLPNGIHREFAQQICNEQLEGKAEIAGKMVYRWTVRPNAQHDYGDVMAMIYALAGWRGIGTGGKVVEKKKAVAFVGRR